MIGTSIVPGETDTPLVIDTNTVLTGTVAPKQFKAVTGRHAQILDATTLVDHTKLSERDVLNVGGQLATAPSGPYQLGFPVCEALEHGQL
jgi:hypothetical protein